MGWNYNMDLCPINTKVYLLSADDCLLLPQSEYIGTIINKNGVLHRGECIQGDADMFYRSKIVAWKLYE